MMDTARAPAQGAARRSVLGPGDSLGPSGRASSSTRSSATASRPIASGTSTMGRRSRSRVGQPVLPAFLSVVFDPTLQKLGNIELMGHYLYDDEGVKARRVTVVDKGILKTFLLDRAPRRRLCPLERPRPGGAGLRAGVAAVEPARRVEPSGVDREAARHAPGRSAEAGQAVRPAVRQHRRRVHQDGPRIGQRFQRPAEHRVSRSTPTPRVRPSSCAASILIGTPLSAFGKDRRDRRQGGHLQRRLRRGKRRRAGVGIVARRCWSARSRCRRRRSRRSRCRFSRRPGASEKS